MTAEARAEDMDLGSGQDEAIPVLMDAVYITDLDTRADRSEEDRASAAPAAAPNDTGGAHAQAYAPEIEGHEIGDETPQPVSDQEYSDLEDWEDPEAGDDPALGDWETAPRSENDAADADDILLDYDEREGEGLARAEDNLATLAPDYGDVETGDVETGEVESEDEPVDEEERAESIAAAGDSGWEEDGYREGAAGADEIHDESARSPDYGGDWQDDDSEAMAKFNDFGEFDDSEGDVEEADGAPPRAPASSFEDSLDNFSLSAGERIGFERKPRPAQSSLFDELDPEDAPAPPPVRRKSLFSAFSRIKSAAQSVTSRPDAGEAAGKAVGEEAELAWEPESPPPLVEPEAVVVARPPRAKSREQRSVKPAAEAPPRPAPTQPSEVLVINIMARQGRRFRGDELLEALITSGLKFGDMNIFHMRMGVEGKGPTIFSVANILNPGTFDLNRIDELFTVGVSLFLPLPAPINNLEAFEQMLGTARQVQTQLQGDLRDDNRNLMTGQTIEHYRQRVRDFELR
ncbi:MAG: cell division protein ZipA, partial [Pseudohongiellaceae bacterium]